MTTNENNENKLKRATRFLVNTLSDIIHGRWFSPKTMSKHAGIIMLVVALFLGFNAIRFEVQVKLEKIVQLRKELVDARTDMVNVSAEYSNLIRESEIQESVNTRNLKLSVPDQPPYNLDYYEQEESK